MIKAKLFWGIAVLVIAGLMIGACSNSNDEKSIPTNTPEKTGKEVSVDATFSGKEIEAAVGGVVTLTLESNPTTGFKWAIASNSDASVLQEAGNRFEAPPATEPPKLGAGGNEIWTFKALKEGTSTISMVYSRSWERSVPPAKTFVVTIHVVP